MGFILVFMRTGCGLDDDQLAKICDGLELSQDIHLYYRGDELKEYQVLLDVVRPDLACVACNAARPPDEWVVKMLRRLTHCPFDEVSGATSTTLTPRLPLSQV